MIGLPVKFALIAIAILLPGCATAVYHPEKTEAEMQADVELCTTEANDRYRWDAVTALVDAFDCLEAKGYSRTNKQVAERVDSAASGRRSDKPQGPVEPCRIPCR